MDAFGDIRSMVQREGGWSPARGHELTTALAGWGDPDDLIERVWPYVVAHVPAHGVWRSVVGIARAQGAALALADLERRELVVASGERVVFVRGERAREEWRHAGPVVALAGGWGEWMSVSAREARSWGAGPAAWTPLERAPTRRVEAYGEWSWAAREGAIELGRLERRAACALRAGWEGRVDAGPTQIMHAFEVGSAAIGRSPACELFVGDATLARRHAVVEVRRDPRRGIVGEVVDMGTTSGTYVNGRRVSRHALRDHEIVVCGRVAVTMRRVMWAVG